MKKEILIVNDRNMNSDEVTLNKYFLDILDRYDNLDMYKTSLYCFDIDEFDIDELFKCIETGIETIGLVLHISKLDILINIYERAKELGLNIVVISDINFGLDYRDKLDKYKYESGSMDTVNIGDILNPYWDYIKFQLYHLLTHKDESIDYYKL